MKTTTLPPLAHIAVPSQEKTCSFCTIWTEQSLAQSFALLLCFFLAETQEGHLLHLLAQSKALVLMHPGATLDSK